MENIDSSMYTLNCPLSLDLSNFKCSHWNSIFSSLKLCQLQYSDHYLSSKETAEWHHCSTSPCDLYDITSDSLDCGSVRFHHAAVSEVDDQWTRQGFQT